MVREPLRPSCIPGAHKQRPKRHTQRIAPAECLPSRSELAGHSHNPQLNLDGPTTATQHASRFANTQLPFPIRILPFPTQPRQSSTQASPTESPPHPTKNMHVRPQRTPHPGHHHHHHHHHRPPIDFHARYPTNQNPCSVCHRSPRRHA